MLLYVIWLAQLVPGLISNWTVDQSWTIFMKFKNNLFFPFFDKAKYFPSLMSPEYKMPMKIGPVNL